MLNPGIIVVVRSAGLSESLTATTSAATIAYSKVSTDPAQPMFAGPHSWLKRESSIYQSLS